MKNASRWIRPAAWTILPTVAFGLGWILKPVPPSSAPESATGAPARLLPESPDPLLGSRKPDPDANAPGDASVQGSRRSWSAGEISALGQSFRSELDPIRRRAAFLELLDGMTVENAREIRAQIADLPADSAEFRDFHYAWGKIGGVDAIMHGAETSKPDMAATLAGWASAHPTEALAWFDALPDKDNETFASQERLRMGLLHGLANTDPAMATQFALDRAASGDDGAQQMLGIVASTLLRSQGSEAAAEWAKNLPPGNLRSAAMYQVGREFAVKDPAAAAAWVGQFADDESSKNVFGAISREWIQKDNAAALRWIASLDNGAARSTAFYTAFEGWAGRDPQAASEYLVGMPDSPDRDQAIGGLVSRHRWEDPVAAITWADTISDETTRIKTIERAGQAYLRRDRDAAMEWLPASGLSEASQKRILENRR